MVMALKLLLFVFASLLTVETMAEERVECSYFDTTTSKSAQECADEYSESDTDDNLIEGRVLKLLQTREEDEVVRACQQCVVDVGSPSEFKAWLYIRGTVANVEGFKFIFPKTLYIDRLVDRDQEA